MTSIDLCRSALDYGKSNGEKPMTTLAVCLALMAGMYSKPTEAEAILVEIAISAWIEEWGAPLFQTISKWIDKVEEDCLKNLKERGYPTNS